LGLILRDQSGSIISGGALEFGGTTPSLPHMSPFRRSQQVFDPAELAVLQAAYEDACRDLKLAPEDVDGADGDERRHALARALLHAAAMGERNPTILKTQALVALKLA
jgi:hypothetical protein